MQLATLNDKAKTLATLFKNNNERIVKAAPRQYDPQRLVTIAFNACAYNTDLLECLTTAAGQASLIGGVMETVKLGLALGGPLQDAWLLPFNDKRAGGKVATLVIGYQGFRNLIDRSRSVIDMHPRAVHVEDFFEYVYGDEPRIHHRPLKPMPQTKKELRAVYAVARLRGGGKQMEVLEIEEIEAHRNRSRAKDSGPWVTDYVPMALKTAMRKLSKNLPKTSMEIARALDLDEKADRGVEQGFETDGIVTIDVTPNTEPGKGVLGKLTQSMTKKPAVSEMADADLDAEIAAQEK